MAFSPLGLHQVFMWERADGHKSTCPVDAAAFASISLPLPPFSPRHIPPPAPPVPPRAFATCSACRNKTVLSSVRSCLLRQCDRGCDNHRHPQCHDVLVGIQLLGNTNESSYDGCVRVIILLTHCALCAARRRVRSTPTHTGELTQTPGSLESCSWARIAVPLVRFT